MERRQYDNVHADVVMLPSLIVPHVSTPSLTYQSAFMSYFCRHTSKNLEYVHGWYIVCHESKNPQTTASNVT
jgi:hypothetical protein